MASNPRDKLMIIFVALITATNCQPTIDDGDSCSGTGSSRGVLGVLANQQKVIVNKLDAIQAAVESNQAPLPVLDVSAQVAALKCKYVRSIFRPLKQYYDNVYLTCSKKLRPMGSQLSLSTTWNRL